MITKTRSQPTVGKRTVMIVDDHPVIRQALARLLDQEPDIEVCEGADNVPDALKLVKEIEPDLVVIDLALNDSHGIELISQIKAHNERIKMVVWSMFDDKVFAERVLRAGAIGYINKQESIDTMIHSIRRALQGDMCFSPQMTSQILRGAGNAERSPRNSVAGLSNRELAVFHMIGQGLTTKLIARKLGLSPKTIEAHREKIKSKLNVHNAAELNRRAVQWVLENC